MRRGVVNGTDALETVNTAATVISSAENHVPRASAKKKRWQNFWNLSSCFGLHKNHKRTGVVLPEMTATRAGAPTGENSSQPLPIVLPFIAPPSSPASFIPSEPPSATHSPTGILSLNSVSANMYSPGGPASMFAIGPYAHETQLVSPPVFSTFTTEPSTAPYTPPPESVHLTRPPSLEVPFARLLEPNFQNNEGGQRSPLSQYEFQSYHLQPGSPVSHLISPCSGISGSGTSSPFLDREFASRHPFFLEFKNGDPPKLLDLDKIVVREWKSHQGSGTGTPDALGPRSCDTGLLNRQHSDVAPLPDASNGLRNDDTVVDYRVSFEITSDDVIRCVEQKAVALPYTVLESVENVEHKRQEKPREAANINNYADDETSTKTSENAFTGDENEQQHRQNQTITLGSTKEFNFDNVDGGKSDVSIVGHDWWANEKVVGEEVRPYKNWSFFRNAADRCQLAAAT